MLFFCVLQFLTLDDIQEHKNIVLKEESDDKVLLWILLPSTHVVMSANIHIIVDIHLSACLVKSQLFELSQLKNVIVPTLLRCWLGLIYLIKGSRII
jgi:hypothetical protein